MRRQLRASGGITNARQGYGIGSWVKERVRKLIPNELASVATKAAPFVAPFFPGAAAAMRGIGRFDQRGSMSDAMKQAGATYGFGKLAGKLGGAEGSGLLNPGGQTYTKAGFDAGPIGKMFAGDPSNVKIATEGAKPVGMESVSKATEFMKNIPIIGELPPLVQQQLLIGGVTSAGTYVYEKFLKEEPPQDESETMEEYMARRKENVGSKMRNYFDSYFTFDKNYSSMTDEQKDAEVARYNVNQGGLMRQNYQTGGISMTNTMAQNRAINNARRTQNQEQLQKGRDTQKATQELDSYFGKGSSTSNPNRQAFITKNFNSMPVQSAAGFNFSGAISDPFNVMSYDSKNRAGIINTIASNYAQERRNQAAPTTSTFNKQASIDAAAAREAKAKAYYQALEQKQIEAYGRGVKTLPELFGGDAYKAEAATLGGMNPGAYMDYLLTGDPQDIMYKYNQSVDGIQNPNYDPEFASYEDMYGTNPRNPYDIYYQNQLQRQIDQGIPEAERIQKGQVLGLPGMLPTSGTTPNIYESYEDALARTKRDMGLNQGGRVGLAEGSDDMVLPMEKPQVERMLTYEEAKARNPEMFVDTTTSAYGGAVPEGTPTLEKVFELEVAEIAKVILGTRSSPREKGEVQDTETMSSKDFMKNAYLIPKVKKLSENYGYSEAEILKMIKDEMMTYSKPKKEMMNKGGIMRLNYMIGGEAKQMEAGAPPIMYSGNMDPNAQNQQAGLPAVPGPMQMAEDGPEFDMRENGGFQPLGRQEGKDDVPAMLAKNEFVMTADAVRAAGGGSIQKGAQKMYDTMKKLESRVS